MEPNRRADTSLSQEDVLRIAAAVHKYEVEQLRTFLARFGKSAIACLYILGALASMFAFFWVVF